MPSGRYDPASAGTFEVSTQAGEAEDEARGITFPIDIWAPAGRGAGSSPLVLFSHYSGGDRRKSSFLCGHLASHGYVVAALDHSEIVDPRLARRDGETPAERKGRVDAIIASRVPDVRFLLDHVLARGSAIDASRIGIVGHSFGGWTALAAPESDRRICSIVALAPGGSERPRPGIIPSKLTFDWGRAVPVMFVAAENDVPVPLQNVVEVFDRAPSPKRLFVLRRADHQHFVDDVEGEHEAVRAATFPGESAWIPAATRPVAELMSGEDAHRIVRALTLAHFDATLRGNVAAGGFLDTVATSEREFVYGG